MADTKWIKVSVDIFNNRKMKYLHSLKDGYALELCWFKLLVLGGIVNDRGLIYLVEDVPYTSDMLAEEFKMPTKVIQMALDTFQKLKMIDIDRKGIIYIAGWEEHQNEDKLTLIREQNKARKQRQREKQRGDECHLEAGQSRDEDEFDEQDTGEVVTDKMRDVSRDGHVTERDSERDKSVNVTQQNKKENKNKIKTYPPCQEDRKERKKKESGAVTPEVTGHVTPPSCPPGWSEDEYRAVKPLEGAPFMGQIALSQEQVDTLVGELGHAEFEARCSYLAGRERICEMMRESPGHFTFLRTMQTRT